LNFDEAEKSIRHVIPAKAGIHNNMKKLDSHLRGNDTNVQISVFYDFVHFEALLRHQFQFLPYPSNNL